MEYYVNKDPVVAGKIFEVGLKTFPLTEDPYATQYVLHYLEFLMCLNDDNNTRALFERALSAVPAEKSRPIWNRYIEYETQYGDLSNLYRIEKRISEVFSIDDVNSIEAAAKTAKKWAYYDIDYVGEVELGISALRAVPRIPPPATQIKIGTNAGGNKHSDSSRSLSSFSGVDTSKYPKPETSRWTMYKPEPGMARLMDIVTVEADITQKAEKQASNVSTTVQSGMLVPEAIARFASALPKKDQYNGNRA
jgi:cleavage stimulation factor subunit 3